MVLRIFKIIAASGFLAALECTKFVFGRCSAADPQWGAYSAPPDPLASLRGLTSKGEGDTMERRKGEKEGRQEMGGTGPLSQISGSASELYYF